MRGNKCKYKYKGIKVEENGVSVWKYYKVSVSKGEWIGVESGDK